MEKVEQITFRENLGLYVPMADYLDAIVTFFEENNMPFMAMVSRYCPFGEEYKQNFDEAIAYVRSRDH